MVRVEDAMVVGNDFQYEVFAADDGSGSVLVDEIQTVLLLILNWLVLHRLGLFYNLWKDGCIIIMEAMKTLLLISYVLFIKMI